jgi:oxalate---CoA ligase
MDSTLSTVIRSSALARPDALAILAPGRAPLNFAGLWQQVRLVGTALRERNLTPAARVAIILPDGPEMATALLSVAACATVAPLNPTGREDDLRSQLQAVRASAVLMPKGEAGPAAAAARGLGLPTLEMEPRLTQGAGEFVISSDGGRPVPDLELPGPDDIALLLQTSGTTAKPKVVPLIQQDLVASARNVARHLALTDRDRSLIVMPLFHSHGIVGALLSSIVAGASVVCTPGWRDEEFFDWVAEFEPTWYTATPPIHQAIIRNAARYRQKAPTHRFRFVRSTSASLPAPTFARLEEALGAPVIESFGMTEWSQMASNPLPPAPRKAGSVGLPSGLTLAVIDAAGNRMPNGTVGELVVQGAGLMRRYDNDDQATAASFIDGWFRTGDCGRFDAEGYLFIEGRLKEIINRGGEKVSPLEVESALLQHPDVAETVAFPVPHKSLGEDVAAAVVLRTGGCVDEAALRALLLETLPAFKVPSSIALVAAIPRSPTGKVRREDLHATLLPRAAARFASPRSDLEHSLAMIFAEVLEQDTIGVDENFFAIGGDSLSAIRIINRIGRQQGFTLPVTTLFRHPTIAELASELERLAAETKADASRIESEIARMSSAEIEKLLASAESEAAPGTQRS